MRAFLALLLLTTALLSGCASDSNESSNLATQSTFTGEQFQGTPTQGIPAAGSPTTHGEPQRMDSAVTTGADPNQIFTSWARQTVTITNDFGGAALGVVSLGLSAGSITVLPGTSDGYDIEIQLEARAETEQQAREALDRMTVSHEDNLDDSGLHLTTGVRYQPTQQPTPLPTIQLWNGVQTEAVLTMTVPAGPAYDLWASASSGDVSVSDLRGPRFRLDASSGDVSATGLNAGEVNLDASSGDLLLEMLQVQTLTADTSSGSMTGTQLGVGTAAVSTSSGDIDFDGRFDGLTASTSSGDITIRAQPTRSAQYELDASSGNIVLEVAIGAGLGYDVSAETSSGSLDIDLPDSQVVEESESGDSKQVRTLGFDAVAIQTTVTVFTSSGDITVSGAASDIL